MKIKGLHVKLSNKHLQLLLLFVLLLISSVKAQANQVIRIGFTDSRILHAFRQIESVIPVKFVYNREDIDNNKRINLSEKERTIADLLNELSFQTGLDYKIIGDVIATTRKNDARPPSGLTVSAIPVLGKVTDNNGEPLVGATVKIKGSDTGVTTDVNGNFSIEAAPNSILVISYTGFVSQEIAVNNRASLVIQLQASSTQLGEVVVTALGIKRERKSLGYSITEVKGDELTQARDVNVINSLVGKVAGLNVNAIAGGPGASSNVIIRGISSIGQTNQPLYVVNGIPMESQPNSTLGTQYDNAPDMGDAIGNINPDDIESISVLKGAAASALYGYRAKAGVILITTKSGKGNGIEFNSNYVAEQIMNPTDWQYVYGQGANNIKPTNQLAAFQSGQSSWGAKLDGSDVVQFDGVARPYMAQKNNLENFYRTGSTFTNTIAFNKTLEAGAIRFSASDLTNQAVIPNSGLNRQNFNLRGNYNITKRLVIDASADYILEQANNRPFLSDGPGNSNYNVMFLPTSVDVNTLKKTVNDDGSEYAYSSNAFATNPWFAASKFINDTKRQRLLSSVNLRYNFDNGYFIQGRAGRDAYNDRYTSVVPSGTAYRPTGSIIEQSTNFSDINADVLAGKPFKVNNDFTVTPNIGASYRRTYSEGIVINGSNFAVPFTYNVLNAKDKSIAYNPSESEVQSVYGTLELAYKGYLYLNGSARSDWFSTLATPGANNTLNIVYPSVSGSFVFSELLQNDWLSFGKLRAGYAIVGQATSPYNTQLSYGFNSATLNGLPLGTIINQNVPNSSLTASKASELEIGTELSFFKNRVSLDISWYDKKSTNEIVPAPASITSGYGGAILNIGELQNRGVEALISVSPFKNSKFSWTSSLNGSVNNNKVLSLADGQASFGIGTSRSGVGFTQNIVGYASAQVMAYDYKYDADGKIALDANGVPVRGDLKPYGSAYHKWVAGWNNEFSYKRINLAFLIDGKFGGKIFSATDYYGYIFGLHKATLVNREGTFGNNLDAATYYSTLANNVSRMFVQDASFIKFRQITLGYSFPSSLFNNHIKGLTLSLVGRNLFTIMKKTDNIDPEANYTANAQGLELGGVPPVRTYGLNLSVKL